MLKVAVTGPISSGKSTVCEMLLKQHAFVINADEIVHKLLLSDKNLQIQIKKLLNSPIDFSDSSYKKQISKIVFTDKTLLRQYENLLHPLIVNKIQEAYAECLKSLKYKLFVCEVPLLYEIGLEKFFDKVIYIFADETTCKKRFCHKTNYDPSEWDRRMMRFFPAEEMKKKASFVITNTGDLKDLKSQINNIINSLQIN